MSTILFANYQLNNSLVEPMNTILEAINVPSESVLIEKIPLEEFPDVFSNPKDFFLFCQQFGPVKDISGIRMDSVSSFCVVVAYCSTLDASKLIAFVKLLKREDFKAGYASSSLDLLAIKNFDFATYGIDHPFISKAEREFGHQFNTPYIHDEGWYKSQQDHFENVRRDSVISATSNDSLVISRVSDAAKTTGIIDYACMQAIVAGIEQRTTVMIRNIPNKYTPSMLQEFLDPKVRGLYDFLYLRMDFKNKCNVGYAFINFISPKSICSLKDFIGIKMPRFKSEKKLALSFASIQGLDKLITKFQNSSVMLQEDKEWRPKLYHTEGPLKGQEKAFPKPLSGQYRPKSNILYSRQ